MGNTQSIGIAYSDQDITGSDQVLADVRLGYLNSVRQTVVQATSLSTAVTLNSPVGTITVQAHNFGIGETVEFTFNNSNITVNSNVVVTKVQNATTITLMVNVVKVTNGSATIRFINMLDGVTANMLATDLNFMILNNL